MLIKIRMDRKRLLIEEFMNVQALYLLFNFQVVRPLKLEDLQDVIEILVHRFVAMVHLKVEPDEELEQFRPVQELKHLLVDFILVTYLCS